MSVIWGRMTFGSVSSIGREWISPCCDNHYPIPSDTPFSSEVECRCGKNYHLQFWKATHDNQRVAS